MVFSSRLDALVPLLEGSTIYVPDAQIKQQLLLAIARQKGIAMGLKIQKLPSPPYLDVLTSVYQQLLVSVVPEVVAYINGKERYRLELASLLTQLFITYHAHGFTPTGWQEEMYRKVPFAPPHVHAGKVICFGIDYLPILPHACELELFLFSPCSEFWADLVTDRERKFLTKHHVVKEEGPKLLENWGKLGRRMLQHEGEAEEFYPEIEPKTLLTQLQYDLLHFTTSEKAKDDSIKIFRTGASKLQEVECIRDEILRMNIPFHDICILASDVEGYAPLIQYVFEGLIPYRIAGIDMAPRSSFRQALVHLCNLGRFDVEDVLALFETRSFYKKRKWDVDLVARFRDWVRLARIRWGKDGEHRKQVLAPLFGESKATDEGSWKQGLDFLVDTFVHFTPHLLPFDEVEELLETVLALQRIDIGKVRTLHEWAHDLEAMANEHLEADSDDEAHESFIRFLKELRESKIEGAFPYSVIEKLMLRPSIGQIHASELHAVRIEPFESVWPCKALFLLGQSEEQFPKMGRRSTLDQLQGKAADSMEKGRYLFLQALFAAEERLCITYCHLSPDEGKPVGASLPVQELLLEIPDVTCLYKPFVKPESKPQLSWPAFEKVGLPQGEVTIALSDLKLLARHPWKFYLQKALNIHLNDELEPKFPIQKAILSRASLNGEAESDLDLPQGFLGRALLEDTAVQTATWKERLAEWGLTLSTVPCRKTLDIEGTQVHIVGDIKNATEKGLVVTSDEWKKSLPEALLAGDHVWLLKSGKAQRLENRDERLKQFVRYYFHALKAPPPMDGEDDSIAKWVRARGGGNHEGWDEFTEV